MARYLAMYDNNVTDDGPIPWYFSAETDEEAEYMAYHHSMSCSYLSEGNYDLFKEV